MGGIFNALIAPTIFMQELRRICDKHGILLVVDEIQMGFFRTGTLWAFEHFDATPDIMRVGHALRNGAVFLYPPASTST